ncbi:ATP-binding cassette domain-containing protein [Aureimonas altamirensis]|uniref:ATP-binding cassette domain-containing protein n=1 Tax=Aureimonas altamirensis TaxID=370622 RepID=UPI00301A4C09
MSAAAERPSPQQGGFDIRLAGLTKSFDDRPVLRRLDLHVPAGQFLAVVGRSGGGKSTLMRLLAGLDVPTAGKAEIDGVPATARRASTRLLFQEPRLVPWARVLHNVGIARGEGWRARAQGCLADVGLLDRAMDWPRVLSGGQKQRVALARALASDPHVLLLDEPFGALDALTRLEMHALLEGLWLRSGFTTVLITHDVAEAVALADRVIVLRDGVIALDIAIDLPRPRRELTDADAVALQAEVLAAV